MLSVFNYNTSLKALANHLKAKHLTVKRIPQEPENVLRHYNECLHHDNINRAIDDRITTQNNEPL